MSARPLQGRLVTLRDDSGTDYWLLRQPPAWRFDVRVGATLDADVWTGQAARKFAEIAAGR